MKAIVISLHQLIVLIILYIKILTYNYQKLNTLQDILHLAKNCEFQTFITQKIFDEKTLYYRILKSFQDKLQQYVIKIGGFRLKNLR